MNLNRIIGPAGLLAAGLTTAPVVAQCDAYFEAADPLVRAGHGTALDTQRGVLVAFGGLSTDGPRPVQTSEWDEAGGWRVAALNGPSPSPRVTPGMAYDVARGVTLLYGGSALGVAPPFERGDLWQWDGTSWTEVPCIGDCPPPDSEPRLVYDPQRAVTWLITGDETWAWDGGQWTQAAAEGAFGSAVFDAARGVVVVVLDEDREEWDGAAWTHVSGTDGPPFQTRAAYDATRGRVVAYGGGTLSNASGETWEIVSGAWQLIDSDPNLASYWHTTVYDPGGARVVAYGGQAGFVSGELTAAPFSIRAFDGVGWEVIAGHPWPRRQHGMVHDSARDVIVLAGGNNASLGTRPNHPYKTWEFDGANWARRSESGAANPFINAMAYDRDRQVSVLFDGTRTWELGAAGGWTEVSSSGPTGATACRLVYDVARGVSTLHASRGGARETWAWNGSSWTQVSTGGPTAGTPMAYDPILAVTVAFGAGPSDRQTWEWNGAAWAQVASDGPAARSGHAVCYHPRLSGVMVYGGDIAAEPNAPDPDALFWWDGQNWRSLGLDAGDVPTRDGHEMVYRPADDAVLIYGGVDRASLIALRLPGPAGDVNWDGVVTIDDVLIVLGNFGATGVTRTRGDLDGDGVVTLKDLLILLRSFGERCPP